MKTLAIYIITLLSVFVFGYAIGRRVGKKEGYREAEVGQSLVIRQQILEGYEENKHSNIEA